MSRFSKAAAEALGWSFAHESGPVELADSASTGVVRTVPAKLTAEKFLDLPGKAPHTITETAETLGLLLERIHLYEQHLEARGLSGLENEVSDSELLARQEENDRVAGEADALQAGIDTKPEGRTPATPAKNKRKRRSLRRKAAK